MKNIKLDEIDKSLEIAAMIRSSETGYARDYRSGSAFGADGDMRRLDAFTLGLLDALASRIGARHDTLKLLTYLHKALEHGPGQTARHSYREMFALYSVPELARYVAGGRYHIVRVMSGGGIEIGHFTRLLVEELDEH